MHSTSTAAYTLKQFTKTKDNDSLYKIEILTDGLEQIFNNKLDKINFHAIYSKCYEICQNGMTQELYVNFINLVEKIVSFIEDKLLNSLDDTDGFSHILIQNYNQFKINAKTVADSLLYLERIRQRFENKNCNLFIIIMNKFIKMLMRNFEIKNKILSLIQINLSKIRNQTEDDLNSLKINFQTFLQIYTNTKEYKIDEDNVNEEITENINILINLLETETQKIYSNFFQDKYKLNLNFVNQENDSELEEENFSTLIKSENNNILKCSDFLKNIDSIFEMEENIFSILSKSETQQIFNIIIESLLINNINFIFLIGVKHFFHSKDYEMLNLIYKLFHSKFNTNPTKFYQNLNQFIINHLKLIEKDFVKKNNFNKIEYFNFYHFIEEINETKKRLNEVLINSFERNTKVEQMTKSNLEKIVNKHEDFLNNFIQLSHEEIKIAIKNKSNSKEFNEKFLNIFKLINDKDLFELEYRKLLSKRLLRNSSMIRETEYEFYAIMKKESGISYVKKIENMINDIFQSQDLNLEFRISQKKKNAKNNLDFYVKVISSENWPLEGINMKKGNNISVDFNDIKNNQIFPIFLDSYIQNFTNFYYNKFKNRQLIFIHDLAWADVTGRFIRNKKSYQFIVSSIQMSILVLFNSKRSYYINEIIKKLEIKEDILFENLTSLINCGLFIINNKEILSDSILILNDNFYNKDNRIILNTFAKKLPIEKLEEVKEISHSVLEDRKHQIDAAIMRILKQNKKINYEILKLKILENVSNYFVPEINTIKSRLDNLLDRNFIGRDVNDPNLFMYLV